MHSLLLSQYGVKADTIRLLSDHGESKAYHVQAGASAYVLKTLPSYIKYPEREAALTAYLACKGIPVARILDTVSGGAVASSGGRRFQLQEYVPGEPFAPNSAPDWYLHESARLLGSIQTALAGYPHPLERRFSGSFFSHSAIGQAEESYLATLKQAVDAGDTQTQEEIKERLNHLEVLKGLTFQEEKMTYTGSHGDYWPGQILVHNKTLTVIDWADACCLPACWEPIMFYTYASPECETGEIDPDRLKRYLGHYLNEFPLTRYDLSIMPFLYYYQLGVCNYYDPYVGLPQEYLNIARLCTRLMRWLRQNAKSLSEELGALAP